MFFAGFSPVFWRQLNKLNICILLSEIRKNTVQIFSKGIEKKEHANWNSHIASSSILLMQRAKLYFYQAFLNFTNSIQGNTLINIGFLIKKDF